MTIKFNVKINYNKFNKIKYGQSILEWDLTIWQNNKKKNLKVDFFRKRERDGVEYCTIRKQVNNITLTCLERSLHVWWENAKSILKK